MRYHSAEATHPTPTEQLELLPVQLRVEDELKDFGRDFVVHEDGSFNFYSLPRRTVTCLR